MFIQYHLLHQPCGVRGVSGPEVEQWACNHEVPSSSPRSGSQIWDFSLAHTWFLKILWEKKSNLSQDNCILSTTVTNLLSANAFNLEKPKIMVL